MISRVLLILALTLVSGLASIGTVSAAVGSNPHDQPSTSVPDCVDDVPGSMTSGEAETGMMESGSTTGEMTISRDTMLADLQLWFESLPPSTSAKLMEIAGKMCDKHLEMLHYEFHHTNLLHQPPGQILNHVQEMASAPVGH